MYLSAGVVRGCHRTARHSYRLGASAGVERVFLADGYAAVHRSTVDGASLRVYDLRHRRPVSPAQRRRSFNLVKLDPKGVAVFHATGMDGVFEVGTSRGDVYKPAGRVDDVGAKGAIVGFRLGNQVTLFDARREDEMFRPAADGTILRLGELKIDVAGSQVSARKGSGPQVALGSPVLNDCSGRESCSGWGRFQVFADRLVRDSLDLITSVRKDIVDDLLVGRSTTICTGDVESQVVTETGRVACGQELYGAEIVSEGVVIDAGPGVDPHSLTRRDNQLVWVHDGTERTAPLPG